MTIDLATLVERHGTAGVLSVGGAVIGLLFGFFAQRSRFCLRAAVIEFWRGKFAEKLSVWLLAFATALIAVQGLILAGWLDVSGVRQLANRGSLSGALVGGLLFGEHFLATFQDRTEQQAQSELLHRLAYVDGLTGIANRRQFDQQLEAEWRRCRRSGKPLAVLLLDIDYFKQYNDLYGHQQGDECLKAVATALRGQLGRSHDLVARYGGEEFVCLLPECDAAGALHKGQELCHAVQALGLAHAQSRVADVVTISVGVACQVPDGEGSPAALLQQADMQLYQAKAQGRNRALGAH